MNGKQKPKRGTKYRITTKSLWDAIRGRGDSLDIEDATTIRRRRAVE